MALGQNIKKYRKEKKLTQKELASLAGVNEVTIRSYEAEKYRPKIETLQKIADALDVSIATLDPTLYEKKITVPKFEFIQKIADELIIHKSDIPSGQSDQIIHELVNEILAKETNCNTIGHRIKLSREALGLSQRDLANMINISEEAISKYESDPQEDIPLIIIKKIAKKLHVSNNYIIWGSDDYPYIYPDLENFLNSLNWGVQAYVPCSQNDNCLLTDDNKESQSKGIYQKKCKKCPNNRIDYVIYNTRKSYLFSEEEYDDLESCILPYLNLRLNECLDKKKPLSKVDLENMGLGWLTEP